MKNGSRIRRFCCRCGYVLLFGKNLNLNHLNKIPSHLYGRVVRSVYIAEICPKFVKALTAHVLQFFLVQKADVEGGAVMVDS